MPALTPDELRMTIRTALFDHFGMRASGLGLMIGKVTVRPPTPHCASNWAAEVCVKPELQEQAEWVVASVRRQFPEVR